MRDIKFRAWHPKNKDMIYFDNAKAKNDPYQSSAVFRLADETPELLMQYTGLKDKNGKEIYEGDIIALEQENNAEVIWNINGAWNKKVISTGQVYSFDYWEYEVIGNIYENPELLNNKQNKGD